MLPFILLIAVQSEFIEGLRPALDIGVEDAFFNNLTRLKAFQPPVCSRGSQLIIRRCAKAISNLATNPFPWCTSTHRQRDDPDIGQSIVEDPMDCIRYACEIFEQFQNCLEQHAIPEVCLFTILRNARVYIDFHFICQLKRTSIEMLNPLRCLQERRLLGLVLFHLADRHGASFVDAYSQGNANAFFRFLNAESLLTTFFVDPLGYEDLLSYGLICLPQSVLIREIAYIIDESCGAVAARTASDYYLAFRRKFNSILKETGLPVNVCEDGYKTIQSETAEEKNPESEDGKCGQRRLFYTVFDQFHDFLDHNSVGTALDTLYGRYLRLYIKRLAVSDFCNPLLGLQLAFRACNLLARGGSAKGIFNIIYFAHAYNYPFMDYPQETTMTRFRSCWNLLVQICGTNTSYFDYVYTVISGTADIQLQMDNLTCQWQDTLIKGYIQVSEAGNLWPTVFSLARRPLFLTSGVYSFGSLTGSLPDLRIGLDGSIKKIAEKCGRKAGRRLKLFYDKLNYAWYTFVKLMDLKQKRK